MDSQIQVKPLPYKTRQKTFGLLFLVFIVAIPFLYLYATGYRFDLDKPANFVSTGGMYIAVDRTGAEIYIDGELVRETRAFRKAFYAQSLDQGTHRVHVQKEGSHTWVKELYVSKHLVTEAEAFNLPLVPKVRVISKWLTATGTAIISTPLTQASSTNNVLATTTKNTVKFTQNDEYRTLLTNFGTTTSTSTKKETIVESIKDIMLGTTSVAASEEGQSTTTVISSGVKLFKQGDELFARWVGSFEQMPYYFCAPDFLPYSTSSIDDSLMIDEEIDIIDNNISVDGEITMHPVQSVPANIECDPIIRIDNQSQDIREFNFFPGSTDLVVVALANGIYVVEIDDRSWQNAQPLILGDNLRMYIENGNIYVYDGELIYQVFMQQT
ncbi:MAG: hypothetical protein K9M10_00750 [Candidatus Pacebacteria bacterium]|nr:hypothetical protein [Candidatus Paceibacterota bacterium]MCF7856991.1 hypothetical protein [Candidatus Paceibacterota bacterium]